MKNILTSPNFSLACAIFNAVFAVTSLLNGAYVLALVGAAFCAFCGRNYLQAKNII